MLAGSSSVSGDRTRGDRVGLGQRRQVMHLVNDEQGPIAAELGEMQAGCGGDALVGGHVAGQPPARVGRVVGGADGECVVQRGAPDWVGEGLFRL